MLPGRRSARWVHPLAHRVVAWVPSDPPRRGDIVLVDGERCRVLRCPVTWDGMTWTMKRGVKVVKAR